VVIPAGALEDVVKSAVEGEGVEISLEEKDASSLALFAGARPLLPRSFYLSLGTITPAGERHRPGAFAEPLAITLLLPEEVGLASLDPARLTGYCRNERGSWAFLGGKLDPDARTFRCAVPQPGLVLLAEYRLPFRDLGQHQARAEVEELARRLVVRGASAERFAPEAAITRAQFVALLTRALSLPEETAPAPVFADLRQGHWARAAAEAAYRAGLVQGDGRGGFAPERTLTREEMAVMLARVIGRYGPAGAEAPATDEVLAGYTDAGMVSAWAKEAVALAVGSGLLKGRSAAELAPQGQSTRAEAAKVVYDLLRALGRI